MTMNTAETLVIYCVIEFFYLAIPGLRLWIIRNRRRGRASWISEACCFFAWVVGFVEFVLAVWNIAMADHITRKYTTEVANEKLVQPLIMKVYYVVSVLYIFYLWGLKAAFIGLYFSLFNPNNTGKALRYALYFVCVFLTATFVVNGSLAAFWCLPIHTTWSMGAHSCSALFNIEPTVIFYTTNVVSDLMIMILPIAVIPSLKLRRRETIALLSVFLLGIFSIGASTARFIVVYKVIANKTNAATSIQSLELWSTVECATAMIAFCAPAYRGWLTKKATSGNGSNLSGSKGKPQIALWTIGSGPRKSKRTMGDSVFADTIDERRTYIGMESQIELKSSPIHEEDESKVRLGNVTEEVYYGQKDYVPYKARGNEV